MPRVAHNLGKEGFLEDNAVQQKANNVDEDSHFDDSFSQVDPRIGRIMNEYLHHRPVVLFIKEQSCSQKIAYETEHPERYNRGSWVASCSIPRAAFERSKHLPK